MDTHGGVQPWCPITLSRRPSHVFYGVFRAARSRPRDNAGKLIENFYDGHFSRDYRLSDTRASHDTIGYALEFTNTSAAQRRRKVHRVITKSYTCANELLPFARYKFEIFKLGVTYFLFETRGILENWFSV